MKYLISIFLAIFLFAKNAKSQCEFTDHENQRGFCTTDSRCCKGFSVNNLCSGGSVCCYGRYECPISASSGDQTTGQCPAIISRQRWKARNPIRQIPSISAVNHLFVHHTDDGSSCFSDDSCSLRLRSLQSYHQLNKRWSDISWNFIIGGNGKVYEGLGWNREGFHTLDWNSQSLGIALIGNFDEEVPSVEMLNALENLILCGLSRGFIRNDYRIHGHRDARRTSCPGENLYQYMLGMSNFQAGPLSGYA